MVHDREESRGNLRKLLWPTDCLRKLRKRYLFPVPDFSSKMYTLFPFNKGPGKVQDLCFKITFLAFRAQFNYLLFKHWGSLINSYKILQWIFGNGSKSPKTRSVEVTPPPPPIKWQSPSPLHSLTVSSVVTWLAWLENYLRHGFVLSRTSSGNFSLCVTWIVYQLSFGGIKDVVVIPSLSN